MIDIKKFCAEGDIRDVLNAPFLFENKIIASNGHIIVILPNDGKNEYQQFADSNFNPKRVIDTIESPSVWTAFNKSEIVFPEKVVCVVCNGLGKAEKEECEECEGEGEVELENGYSTYSGLSCKSCDGGGYILKESTDETCLECAGTGKVDQYISAVEILGLKIRVKYLRLIIDEENLEFAVDDKKDKLIFRCGDGITGAMTTIRV